MGKTNIRQPDSISHLSERAINNGTYDNASQPRFQTAGIAIKYCFGYYAMRLYLTRFLEDGELLKELSQN